MKLDKSTLLGTLPPYRDGWITIHPDQQVKDIIREVLNAHDEFAPYYDKIALYFDDTTIDRVCNKLYEFCKSEIAYDEESADDQTSALPTGILTRGKGDCKHYAGFIGGVLDALNRQGAGIKWKYRFASYDVMNKTPGHVFIVVDDEGTEKWIDPTPGAANIMPTWITDKKISAMPLRRNIAGTGGVNLQSPYVPTNELIIPDTARMVWSNGTWKIFPPESESIGIIEDVIETGLTLITSISTLFGGNSSTKKGAQQKIFDMFPLPAGASASTIQNVIAALNAHLVQESSTLSATWKAAYADAIRQYSNAYNLVSSGRAMPVIVIPPIGSPSFSSIPPGVTVSTPGINNSQVTTTSPGPGVYEIGRDADGTIHYSDGTMLNPNKHNWLTESGFGGSTPNWVWLAAAGAGAFLLFKKKKRA